MRPPLRGVCACAVVASVARPPASVACMPPAISIASTSRRVAPRCSAPNRRWLSSGPTSASNDLRSVMVLAPALSSWMRSRRRLQARRSFRRKYRPTAGRNQGGPRWPGNRAPVAAAPGVGGGIAGHHRGHALAHQHRHLRAVAAVAGGIEQAVALAGVRQAVLRHVDQAAPAVVDAHVRQRRKRLDHAGAQDLAALRVRRRAADIAKRARPPNTSRWSGVRRK